jgi:hypothetical protein
MAYAVEKRSILRLFEGVEPNSPSLLLSMDYIKIEAFCNIFPGKPQREADWKFLKHAK